MEETPEYQDIVHMQWNLTMDTKDSETDDPTHSVTEYASYIGIQRHTFHNIMNALRSPLGIGIYEFEADRTFPDRFN